MLLSRSLQLITCGGINSRRKLVHQLPVLDLLKIAAGGNIQVSIKERNLLEGFIKALNILLGHLPFKVIGILGLGLKLVLQLGHFCSIEVLDSSALLDQITKLNYTKL